VIDSTEKSRDMQFKVKKSDLFVSVDLTTSDQPNILRDVE
jgi:hypothetical protein